MNWRARRYLCKTGGLSISGEPPNLVSFSGNLITSQVGESFRYHFPYHSWLQNFGTLVHHCKKVLVGDLKPSRGQLGGDSSLSIRSTVNGRLGFQSFRFSGRQVQSYSHRSPLASSSSGKLLVRSNHSTK